MANDELLNLDEIPVGDAGPSMERGVLIDGVFWFVGEAVTEASILLRATRRKVRRLVTGVVTFCAVLGALLFVAGILLSFGEDILAAETWWEPSIFMFGLWAALLCVAFLHYRAVTSRLDVVALPKPKAMPELCTLPSLDVVERHAEIFRVTDEEGRALAESAYRLAKNAGHADVLPIHLFAAALSTRPVATLFARLGLSFDGIKDPLRRRLATCVAGRTEFGGPAHDLYARALMLALADERTHVGPLEVFTAAYGTDEFLQELLASKSITREELENALAWMRIQDDLRARYAAFRRAASLKPTGNMDRAYTAIATPFLDKVSDDLTRAAVYGRTSMLIGRDREMADVLRAIEGGSQSVVLVGPPGVGKAAIIEGLADRMVSEDVPKILQDKRLLRLSVPHIVSAQGGTGAEERFLYALQEVAHTGNVVLVIENLHELVGTGQGIDLSSILASELEKGYTFVIGTATPQGYQAIEKSPLRTRLSKVVVEEPERNDAIRILESKVGAVEAKHGVVFTYQALAALVDQSTRYMHDDNLPEKAIELAKEVGLEAGKRAEQGKRTWVTKESVASLVAAKTGVPVTDVTQEEGERLLHIEERMHERVIGQEHAVKAIASALRRARVELRSANRPIANFLFLGPTGVGKTELAKTTAEVFFGSEDNMIRFDMSEYQDQSSVNRLIGGNGEAGLMTEAVRRQPFALLLLDELEKAHPDILNLFLQVMDDGRLTDGTGRTVDFTNVILIATSNAGTAYIQDAIAKGEAVDAIKNALLESELRQIYRPEFLNRFDDTIVFKPLSPEDVVAIAYLMIRSVTERLKAKGITLVVSDDAVHELAQKGYDPKFGARPLRRVVQEHVENAIAEFLLKGQVSRRDTLRLDVGGKIAVEKAPEL
ncbi:ATP-dependent Clp protease ATP-binding subunit [Candidatus Uhrbacteria bacterium]|nr:ATP-dependent Clp protease ATP-binding subunit [Candidatus Uhrbacteria bacterium]